MVMEYKEFRCELCDNGYGTLALAKKCEKKCSASKKSIYEKEEKLRAMYEYPRITARSIPEFIDLIRDAIKANFPKSKNYKLSISGLYFVERIYSHEKPFDAKHDESKRYPGFKLEYTGSKIESRGCIFGSDVVSLFGLYSGCGYGVGNDMMHYQAHIFLDDLPRIKEALQENEDSKKKYATVVDEMNIKHMQSYNSDDYITIKQKDIDAAYAKYQRLRLDLKRYETDVYADPAKKDFKKIPFPALNDVGCSIVCALPLPAPFCPN